MKKKLLLLLLLLFPLHIQASTITKERTTENNYGVNKKWKITESNKNNILKTPYIDANEKIYDFSNILTDSEENEIYNKMQNFIEKTNMDIVFVSTSIPHTYEEAESTAEEYAADFYDYNDFGINFDYYSGVLLLRNTYEEDPYFNVYTFGKAQIYFDYDRCEEMLDTIYPYFKNSNYVNGLNLFIDKFTTYYEEGIPHSMEDYKLNENGILYKDYQIPWNIILITDTIITTIILLILFHKNKLVTKKLATNKYLDTNSKKITISKDKFIREFVTSHAIETSSGLSGGGGHSGIGSSGGGHSSGGGRHG